MDSFYERLAVQVVCELNGFRPRGRFSFEEMKIYVRNHLRHLNLIGTYVWKHRYFWDWFRSGLNRAVQASLGIGCEGFGSNARYYYKYLKDLLLSS